MKVIVAGDFCDISEVSKYIKEDRYSDLFDEVRPTIEEADFSIVNFEFPIVEDYCCPIAKYGPVLKGGRKSINAIKYAGFKACTLANNHILDQGETCCLNTQKLLRENGLFTVGIGSTPEEAGSILYHTCNDHTLAIINCCENEFSIVSEEHAGANPLNPINQWYKILEAKKNADTVMVIVHGGTEFYQLPSQRMKDTYHFFIDAGADAVINHHQHCYSGYEIYNDKPIVYGLGNFCFPSFQNVKNTWYEGFMVELTFDATIALRLIPYIQCKDKPGIRLMNTTEQDDFYKEIKKLNIIISDKKLLENANKSYQNKVFEDYKRALQPYNSRIAKALYNRHILPSFLSKKQVLKLLNHICCESHNESMIHALKNMLKNE